MLELGFGLTIAELMPLFQEAMTSLLEADPNRKSSWEENSNMPVLRSSMQISKARSIITPESLQIWQRDTEIGMSFVISI